MSRLVTKKRVLLRVVLWYKSRVANLSIDRSVELTADVFF